VSRRPAVVPSAGCRPPSRKILAHVIGLPDLLLATRLRDLYPREVVVLGLEPAGPAVGLELALEVAPQ
jgi:hypothetical protein